MLNPLLAPRGQLLAIIHSACLPLEASFLLVIDNRSDLRAEFFFHALDDWFLFGASTPAAISVRRRSRRSGLGGWGSNICARNNLQFHGAAENSAGSQDNHSLGVKADRHFDQRRRTRNADDQLVAFNLPLPGFEH